MTNFFEHLEIQAIMQVAKPNQTKEQIWAAKKQLEATRMAISIFTDLQLSTNEVKDRVATITACACRMIAIAFLLSEEVAVKDFVTTSVLPGILLYHKAIYETQLAFRKEIVRVEKTHASREV